MAMEVQSRQEFIEQDHNDKCIHFKILNFLSC